MKKDLKTPEDFEKVFEALEDPTASPDEYTVVDSLGYCENCSNITEYTYVHDEYYNDYISCNECKITFTKNSYRFPYAGKHPRTGSAVHYVCRDLLSERLISEKMLRKLEYMRSREGQRKILEDMFIERYQKTKQDRERLIRKLRDKESEEHEYFILHGRYIPREAVERNS